MIVTDDPILLARLRSRYEELGSHKLAEYAFTLGLFPPHHRQGATDSVSEYWPPGADTSAPGLLVWDSTFTDAFEEHDDEDDEDDAPCVMVTVHSLRPGGPEPRRHSGCLSGDLLGVISAT